MMKEECLICGAPLKYLKEELSMECAICHKKINSRTCCEKGHFVCDACHTNGMDSLIGMCLGEFSKDPIAILEKMMSMPFCHMHGPEHHVMVGAALLTAYHNAGGKINLESALYEMYRRGKQVPGGACGFWGACGAGISVGIYASILTCSTPLSQNTWGYSNQLTSRALNKIGEIGGPRCCKRDSYLAVIEAVQFTENTFGVTMERSIIRCSRSERNKHCIKGRCPFYGG